VGKRSYPEQIKKVKTIYMKRYILFIAVFSAVQFAMAQTQDAKMKTFIDALMKKMTVEEKIGQLNLPGAGDIVTGQAGNSGIAKKIGEGKWAVCSI